MGPDNTLWQWKRVSGLSHAEAAKVLGWTPFHLAHLEAYDLEHAKAVATKEELDALASLYGCTRAQLLRPPPRDILRRALGYFPPGFTQKEIDVIRHALRVASEAGSKFAEKHRNSIEHKLASMETRRARTKE